MSNMQSYRVTVNGQNGGIVEAASLAEAKQALAIAAGHESFERWEQHCCELYGECDWHLEPTAHAIPSEEPAPKTLPSNPPVDTLDMADMAGVAALLDLDSSAEEAARIVSEWSYEAVEYSYLSVATAREAAMAEWERKTERQASTPDETVVFESNFMQALSNPYMWRAVQQESQKRRAARGEP